MTRPYSLLVAARSGQCIPLQLFVLLPMRAEVVPDVVVEHLSASSHPLSLPPVTKRITVALLSPALLFACLCLPFSHHQSAHKNFQVSTAFVSAYSFTQTLALSHTELRDHQDSVSVTLNKERIPLLKLFVITVTETQSAQKK